jgi:cellulose synthase operon protein B
MEHPSLSMKSAVIAILMLVLAGPNSAKESPTQDMRVTFSELGAGSISLQGVQSVAGLDFGTRKDQLVVGGVLHLRMTYSPSLIDQLSHVRVSLNGQSIGAITLPKADAGHEIERSIALNPRYFSDYNHLELTLIGHYTTECEDPQHSSLWVKIARDSDLTLTVRPLELSPDLALLPAPFFDVHDNQRLVLPIVLPGNAPMGLVRSAGVAASWFGMLADYRSARFPVSFDTLPTQHALVFATNDSTPSGLPLSPVQSPTVSMVDNPSDPSFKLLVFQGKDETQLRQAVEGIVIGAPVLTGSRATIEKVSIERRAPYDAPRWLRGDRPVKLGELIENPELLQGHGISPAAISVNLRLPPDLFTWNKVGVPVTVHYRYTAPPERDNSLLTVSVNNQLLRSYRLPPESEAGRLLVPLLQSDGSRQTRGLLIPGFHLSSDNQMVFQFSMDAHREAACKDIFIDNTRESIDPDSTIDISGFAHYTALPNLALFANAGFPFTRNADLAETAIVLPDTRASSLEQLFFLLGRMGRQTGAAALAYRLVDTRQALTAKNLDLLILNGSASNDLLEHWNSNLPLQLGTETLGYRQLAPTATSVAASLPQSSINPPAVAHVTIRADGAPAGFLSFESPVTRGRTVVALLGNDAAVAGTLVATLDDNSKVPLIRGELALIRNGTVQSFGPDKVYYLGSLPWWQWLWFHVSHHALLLIILSLVAAVGVGLLIYGTLQRRVTRRLEASAGK